MAKDGSNAAERLLVSEKLRTDQTQNGVPPAIDKLSPSPELRLMTETELAQAITEQEARKPKWASDHLGPNTGAAEGRHFRTSSTSKRHR